DDGTDLCLCGSPHRSGSGRNARPYVGATTINALSVLPNGRVYLAGTGANCNDTSHLELSDTPNGIRTRVTALKGRGPRPLADGGARAGYPGQAASSGERGMRA